MKRENRSTDVQQETSEKKKGREEVSQKAAGRGGSEAAHSNLKSLGGPPGKKPARLKGEGKRKKIRYHVFGMLARGTSRKLATLVEPYDSGWPGGTGKKRRPRRRE